MSSSSKTATKNPDEKVKVKKGCPTLNGNNTSSKAFIQDYTDYYKQQSILRGYWSCSRTSSGLCHHCVGFSYL